MVYSFVGVLVHFDSVALKDLYFVDSQWLCDMFAHVVSSEYNSEYNDCIIISYSLILHRSM